MQIRRLKLQNFRGYTNQTIVDFTDFTAFVIKNDVGKSTILDALNIFFNGPGTLSKFEKDDINVVAREENLEVSMVTLICKMN